MTKTFEELVQLKQNGKISWVEFLQQSELSEAYKEWLDDRGEKPDEDNALLFYDMTDSDFQDSQEEDFQDYE